MRIRRKNFLINKAFQLRFCFYVCTWIFALSLMYPLIIANIFDFFLHYIYLDPLGPEVTNLKAVKSQIILLLAGIQTAFLIITFILSIFISHRIAGPLYKLKIFFESARTGQIRGNLFFRKFDYFKDIAESYNGMVDAVSAMFSKSNYHARNAETELEAALNDTTGQTRTRIQSALEQLKEIKQVSESAVIK